MKFVVSLIALFVFLVSSSADRAWAATPTNKAKKATSNIPRWYYWDQMGLKAWNARDKKKAKYYFDRSLVLTDQALAKYKGNLDRITKTRAEGVIDHQIFVIADIKLVTKQEAKNMTTQEVLEANCMRELGSIDDKIKQLQRLSNTSARILGKRSLKGQSIQRSITKYRIRAMQLKRKYERLKGWPMHSYDNGGKFADKRFYEINKDGTIDYVDEPSQDAMRRHDPDFDRNAYWKKHKHVDKRRNGSYYKGLNPAVGHTMPEWYKTQKSKYARGSQRAKQSKKSTTMYAGGRAVKRNTPKYQFTKYKKQENPALKQSQARSRGWGDQSAAKNGQNKPRKQLWGQGKPDPRTTSNRSPKKTAQQLWGQNNRNQNPPKDEKTNKSWGNKGWSNRSRRNEWGNKTPYIPPKYRNNRNNNNNPYQQR